MLAANRTQMSICTYAQNAEFESQRGLLIVLRAQISMFTYTTNFGMSNSKG